MMALSIKEPWATMIASGRKTIETRTWSTKYRGALLLCASAKPFGPLSGNAFAIVWLSSIEEMIPAHESKACCAIYPGAYSWHFEIVERMNLPSPVKGKLGLFDVRYSVHLGRLIVL